jgi:hypothetical protein
MSTLTIERREMVVGEDSGARRLLREITGEITRNWGKTLVVPALLLIASLHRDSELPAVVTPEEPVCFNKWELIGCASWGHESFSGGPGSDDCSVRVVKQDGEFCVWSGPQGAPDPFQR